MTDGIKSLAKIQGNDNNIGVGSKERGDSMKDGNKGSRRAGYMYLRTIIFSNILVRTGVMEIGLKSACVVGAGTSTPQVIR